MINDMSAGQLDFDVGDDRAAILVASTATLVWAVVVAALLRSVTGFGTIDGLVQTLGMTLIHACVSTWETLPTKKIAASFGGDRRKVVWSRDLERRSRVPWAT